jgi:hypothetical protein
MCLDALEVAEIVSIFPRASGGCKLSPHCAATTASSMRMALCSLVNAAYYEGEGESEEQGAVSCWAAKSIGAIKAAWQGHFYP